MYNEYDFYKIKKMYHMIIKEGIDKYIYSVLMKTIFDDKTY